MNINLLIEIISVGCSLTFLFLMMKENTWCWAFGIVASFLSIYLFIEVKLYAESILYFYYVLIGIYGWYKWSNNKGGKQLEITTWGIQAHLLIVVVGVGLSFLLGFVFNKFSDAKKPFIDSTTTIFAFIASYLEANKILSTWIFWIVINGVSIWLYFVRGLEVYAGLMVVYFTVSFLGFYNWNKKYKQMGVA